tara:strand:+ start:1723 stop:1917 length:195 start_codon:yes stop_codon:yes gene_type:complete
MIIIIGRNVAILGLNGYTLSDDAMTKLIIIIAISSTFAFSESGYDMGTYLSKWAGCCYKSMIER